jgi:hypothetical protein
VLTLKSENRVSFTVRLNLNKPRHREAWQRLRSGSASYTAIIVDALTKNADPFAVYPDADELKAIMRQAVAEALHELPVQLISDYAESSGKGEISDEDFDIADDFMSGLGC